MQTQEIPAIGKNGPATGKSAVVDNKTMEIFHVGGDDYKYDEYIK